MRRALYVFAGLILAVAVWVAFTKVHPICSGHYDYFDGRRTRCDLGYLSPWPGRAQVIGAGLAVSGVLALGARFIRR